MSRIARRTVPTIPSVSAGVSAGTLRFAHPTTYEATAYEAVSLGHCERSEAIQGNTTSLDCFVAFGSSQ